MLLLHGEETIEIYKPIEPDTTLLCQETLIDIQDKKKAFVMIFETTFTDKESGEKMGRIISTLFVRSPGGFGRKGTYKNEFPEVPKGKEPDFTVEEKTEPGQAFLYRLNGDYNPLHVDPQMAEMGGFKIPILHGLCFYGVTAKAVVEKYIPENPQALQSMSARFTSHVLPGETLLVETWRQGDTVIFKTRTKERGKAVLKGYCKIKAEAKM
jgi:acyl dehydratase